MIIIPLNTSVSIVALVCMAMVFLVVFFLVVIYLLMPKILDMYFRRKLKEEGKMKPNYDSQPPLESDVNAAIAAAIHLYFSNLHDEESNIITIEEVKKTYSPWRSKIYSVMNDPRR